MNALDEYQEMASSTMARDLGKDMELATLALGNAGEASETIELMLLTLLMAIQGGKIADMVKKVVGHGHPLDRDKLMGELGDQLWYIATTCDWLNIPLSVVATINIEKLRKRYPSGFQAERSVKREEQ